MDDNEEILRVSGSTDATALGATVAHGVYEGKKQSLRAIGAAANNQAIKAVAIASGYAAAKGHDLWVKVGFADVTMSDGVVTAMILKVRDIDVN
jgi:stage V sporulation protein S